MTTKSKKLRELLNNKKIVRIIGAHDGMGAHLAEKAGFEGIWASGLEVSTAHAVPDANILTMSDYLRAACYMNDATSLPVIVDADTGYGNSNNVIYMVKKFEAAGIAAVCIEDKMFPKVNSFVPGRQELAPIAEFVGKIMAAKNAQESKDFMVIARVEALIAGWGMQESLKRAYSYSEAGADAVFIHSKSKDVEEINTFIASWNSPTPLVVCPTTYPAFTVEEAIKSQKVKIYIFANHGIRAAIQAMQQTFKTLANTGDIRSVDNEVASLKEVFEIQGMPQMKEDEKRYLFNQDKVQVVIPAAGYDKKDELLQDLIKDRPLTMLDVNGKSILQRNVEALNNLGLQDIIVVSGHEGEKINVDGIATVENTQYSSRGIVHSIMCAREKLSEKVLVLFSDILFEKNIVERLLKCEEDVVVVIDRSYRESNGRGRILDLVKTQKSPMVGERSIGLEESNPILQIGKAISSDEATHEFIGMVMFSKAGFATFRQIYEELENNPPEKFHDASEFSQADFSDMLQEMLDRGHSVSSLEISKGWMEVHTFENYKKACQLYKNS